MSDSSTDKRAASLTPLFSPRIISNIFTGIWIVSLLLLLFWPQKDLYYYLQENAIPINFLVVFAAALLVVSYTNLSCGKGDMIHLDFISRVTRTELAPLEEERGFVLNGIFVFFVHSLFLFLPFLPVLVISAAMSKISLPVLLKSLSVLYSSSLLCRLFGFQIYLLWGKWSQVGSIICGLFYLFFFIATGFAAPFVNPVLLIFNFFKGRDVVSHFSMRPYPLYLVVVASAAFVLVAASQFVIVQKTKGERP
ncbi:MAG: hypothetical protein GY866_03085 [Proteobacteria bacterium]|nr:hypothetical protein [Pseudomonadota bacterium]